VTAPEDYPVHRSKSTWRWDIFGDGQLSFTFRDSHRGPTWWQRKVLQYLFGSKWIDLHDKDSGL